MEYRRFGRTGLQISTMGMGTGGASRLGLAYGATEQDAIAVVRRGLELGINYFDTAESYENEHVLGEALVGHRDEVVISTKVDLHPQGDTADEIVQFRNKVELSLTKLQTDVIDVFHLHRVLSKDYSHAVDVFLPEMVKLRDEGKIRFLAISESSGNDARHAMLHRAVQDDYWDVIMTSFNLFNQSARNDLFPTTIEKDIAVEIMASARTQFSQIDLLLLELNRLIDTGQLDANCINREDPLDFLHTGGCEVAITEASYRFAAYEPGVRVVLVGTGKVSHLEENVAAINRGPLPDEIRERLASMFGHLQAEVYVPGRTLDPN